MPDKHAIIPRILYVPTVSKKNRTHCFPSKIRTVHPIYRTFSGTYIPSMHGISYKFHHHTGHSFWYRNLFFWHKYSLGLLGTWEKNAFFCFSKFWFLALWGPFFGHFRVFSSLSFVNLLYVLQVTPIDLQTWFLAQRVFMTPLRGGVNYWKPPILVPNKI